MKQIKKQAGFTLIELIMVIVILGVLSAFALPRFADLGGEARAASLEGLAGSIKAASNIAHAQWLVNGDSSSTSVTLEGTSVAMLNGYPTTAATGIGAAAQIDTTNDYDAVITGTTATYSIAGATASATCQVVYTAATASSTTPPVITPPTTVATVTGC